jgi:hypothetical protein
MTPVVVCRAEQRESDVTTDGQSEEAFSSLRGSDLLGRPRPVLDVVTVILELGADNVPAADDVIPHVLNDE